MCFSLACIIQLFVRFCLTNFWFLIGTKNPRISNNKLRYFNRFCRTTRCIMALKIQNKLASFFRLCVFKKVLSHYFLEDKSLIFTVI